jgi:hypothetical protein
VGGELGMTWVLRGGRDGGIMDGVDMTAIGMKWEEKLKRAVLGSSLGRRGR